MCAKPRGSIKEGGFSHPEVGQAARKKAWGQKAETDWHSTEFRLHSQPSTDGARTSAKVVSGRFRGPGRVSSQESQWGTLQKAGELCGVH